MQFVFISPLQGLFLEFAIFSTNMYAALPQKKLHSSKIFVARKLQTCHKAAEQRNNSHKRVLIFCRTLRIVY
jgi:hypothetical protein